MVSPTKIPLLFGTAPFGEEGTPIAKIHDLKECQEILDVFIHHGHRELDTARLYGRGTSEQYLSKLDLKDCIIDTKAFPLKPGDHAPQKLRETFMESLKALKRDKVRAFYLHAPDRNVPYEDTLREVNELYKEGKFEIFGLSNFPAWEVAEFATIARLNGWVEPKIYQVAYNAIARTIEPELVPCARKFGIRIVVYNPIAGGFFSGKVTSPEDPGPKGGRFDTNTFLGKSYRERYLRKSFFDALLVVKEAADPHGIRLTEAALRWLQHHSVLTPQDGVIIGASSAEQLEQNCNDSAKGPLPEDLVSALDEAARIVGNEAPKYWQ